MRLIATLSDPAARKFADYLLTLKIETRLLSDPAGQGVWVCDEDRVPQARLELEAFSRNPADTRYAKASDAARSLRLQEELSHVPNEEPDEDFRRGPRPVTLMLIALSILVAVATNLGAKDDPLTLALYISARPRSWPGLEEVASGQVWRLVSPIFLHFGFLHLFFNLVMLLSLGGQVESLRGSARMLLLVLVLAVVSNLAEFYLGRTTFDSWPPLVRGSPNFGGLSGVVYGLFGYLWLKSIREPEWEVHLPTQTVVIMLGWFGLCLFFDKDVANAAHAGGLAAGAFIGAAPRMWRG
jgi:GlpG protein